MLALMLLWCRRCLQTGWALACAAAVTGTLCGCRHREGTIATSTGAPVDVAQPASAQCGSMVRFILLSVPSLSWQIIDSSMMFKWENSKVRRCCRAVRPWRGHRRRFQCNGYRQPCVPAPAYRYSNTCWIETGRLILTEWSPHFEPFLTYACSGVGTNQRRRPRSTGSLQQRDGFSKRPHHPQRLP